MKSFTLSESIKVKKVVNGEKKKLEKDLRQKTENLSRLEKEVISIVGQIGDERIVVCAKANGREQFHCKIVEEAGKEPQFVPMYDKTFECIGEAVKWGDKIVACTLKNGLIDVNTGETIRSSNSMITIIASNDPDYLAIEKDNQQFLLSQNGKLIRFPDAERDMPITFEDGKIKIISNSEGEKFLICKNLNDNNDGVYKIKNDEKIIPILFKTSKRKIEIKYQFKDWILYRIKSDGTERDKMYNISSDKTYDRPEQISEFYWKISTAIERQTEEKEIMCIAEPSSPESYGTELYDLEFSNDFEMKKAFVGNRCRIINNDFVLVVTRNGNDEVHKFYNRDSANKSNWVEVLKIENPDRSPSCDSSGKKIVFISDRKETFIINTNTGKIAKRLPFYAEIYRDDMSDSDTPNIRAHIGNTIITYNYDMDHIINITRKE